MVGWLMVIVSMVICILTVYRLVRYDVLECIVWLRGILSPVPINVHFGLCAWRF
jgi:hypothetical protein